MEFGKWLRLQWDRAFAWLLVAAGAGALIAGWVGVSGTPYSAEQLPYIISGGVGAVFLLGVAGMLWLSADLRDEWRKLDRIEEAIRERGSADLTPTGQIYMGGSTVYGGPVVPQQTAPHQMVPQQPVAPEPVGATAATAKRTKAPSPRTRSTRRPKEAEEPVR